MGREDLARDKSGDCLQDVKSQADQHDHIATLSRKY